MIPALGHPSAATEKCEEVKDAWFRLSVLEMPCIARVLRFVEIAAGLINVIVNASRGRWANGGGAQVMGLTVERYVCSTTGAQDFIFRVPSVNVKHVFMMHQGLAMSLIGRMMIMAFLVMGVLGVKSHQGERCDCVALLGGRISLAALARAVTIGIGIESTLMFVLMLMRASREVVGGGGGRGSTPNRLVFCDLHCLVLVRRSPAKVSVEDVVLAERRALAPVRRRLQSALMNTWLATARARSASRSGGGRRSGSTFPVRGS